MSSILVGNEALHLQLSPDVRKATVRRGSLIPAIHKWAVSINQDMIGKSNLQSKRQSLDMTGTMGYNKREWREEQNQKDVDNEKSHRRASLDVNVERAVALVNENPDLDDDDGDLAPFGCRRDSLL
ncbi:predicted protein [Phaeodactylum tricornutum CCAP 1055/1]|jgi:hypothetical protein|uniref:Uncharacterized protein n=2 Tax=Phaeodactylum tricornutum TaxID=2850 RepID=B7S459_PHATC|nr:predicted protein [Phaeodactylum tricornutum CCAP 1055/1]EEC42580.1 predicted protein [Phaeodactylum tricornutum CCAP 1055/1]|eukprot:XP_002176344.1 predicted protein [Phaeodactylum tricornutum CCAP 1055/1]